MKIPLRLFSAFLLCSFFFFVFRVKGTFIKAGLHCDTQKKYKELACRLHQNVHMNLNPKI